MEKEKDGAIIKDDNNPNGGDNNQNPNDDIVSKLEEEKQKLIEERDNYKAVALKRLGKLPNDSSFMNGGEGEELSVAEQVKLALMEREIQLNEKAKEDAYKKAIKENNELKLLIKNRPEGSIVGDSGGGEGVKDNVFSREQIEVLKQKAIRLNADPEKFIENAKRNLLSKK